MITIKTEDDITKLREGGHLLAVILATLAKEVKPGVSTGDLDLLARKLIAEAGGRSAFLGYKPKGMKKPYSAALCVSVNDEVVHGIPNSKRIIEEGDVVSLDLGLIHEKLFTDHAVTVAVGKVPPEVSKLIDVTKQSLAAGIKMARAGNRVGDISAAIEEFVEPYGFGIVRELAGHGVGYSVHEDPFVPNYGNRGQGPLLRPGMVIAIEPMLTLGTHEIYIAKDGWTVKTKDGSLAAHFEHTVLITENGPEILTA